MLSAVGGRGIGVGECGFCLKGIVKGVESTNSLQCFYLTNVPFVTQIFFLVLNTVQTLWIVKPTYCTAKSGFSIYKCISWPILFVGGNIGIEPLKTIAVYAHQAVVKEFFFKERYKIPYIVPQIINVFLENDFTLSSSDCNTLSCVVSLSFKKITSFLVRSPFSQSYYFILYEMIWTTRGFPVY